MLLLALQAILLLFQVCSTEGSSTSPTCPEQLICTFPKSTILLSDPLHPGCNKTVCACKGSNNRITSVGRIHEQYGNTIRRYINCTLVEGNLELVGFEGFVSQVEFTKHIEQVTGYVLISRVYANHIDLSSLRLIRGIERYVPEKSGGENCKGTSSLLNSTTLSSPGNPISEDEGYALYVSNTAEGGSGSKRKGLKELWLPKLTEISKGHVAFHNNRQLCHVNTISWDREIFEDKEKQEVNITNPVSTPVCPNCSSNCSDGFEEGPVARCWGSTDDLCQLITRSDCKHCSEENQRCNQQGTRSQCCSAECAAGCSGQGADKCHACKGMNDDGTCRNECPFAASMDPATKIIKQPEKRYQLARYCVKDCPANVPQTGTFCKTFCQEGEFDFDSNVCSKCANGKCDHICDGLGTNQGKLAKDDVIHANNIKYFNKNCTIIEGNLYFRRASFHGDSYCNLGSLTKEAFDVFSNVREITGYLAIEDWPYKDLCIFKNLRRIRGKVLKNQLYALFVYSGKSNLRDLCLNSLESIDNGAVSVANNKYLCYTNTIDWRRFTDNLSPNYVFGNKQECGNILVWENKRLCLAETVDWTQFLVDTSKQNITLKSNQKRKTCRKARCNTQCNRTEGCWGDSPDQCVQCENYEDKTEANGLFTPKYVTDSKTGAIYPGNNVTNCVNECEFTKGVYASEDKQCLPCDPECDLCTGPGPGNCRRCRHSMFEGTCVSSCLENYYLGLNSTCMPCAQGCIDGGCNGSLKEYNPVSGCKSCYHYKDEETNTYMYIGRKCSVCSVENLKKECPYGCTQVNNTGSFECYWIPGPNYALIFTMVGLVFVIICFIVIWKLYRHTTTIKRMRQAIGETMVGEFQHNTDDEEMPLTPSGTAPNQAQLRIVKDTELAMGILLGSGAFGEVHKAVWTPLNIQGEKVKIAVAVKTLKTPEEMTQAANNEIMDEAYMMAYVDCRYLVRLLGIRMTEHVSLITQLMPLGSLLEYVRNEKTKETIHSRQLLNWFLQIAKGMLYLEEKHLVHRDLAARNVLVKTPNHVKITDFGLAKMLDVKEDTYQAEGGKLPIKWLAIECITERKFSHLSDVWAYGVTCWELLTFGARPYEGVRAVEILSLLERGERLPQPPTATIDIYMLLVKCWMVDRMCRPPFTELVSEFSRMVTDPKRYVVMKDDPSHCFSPNPTDEDRFFRQLLEDEKIDDAIIADEPDQYLLRPENNGQPLYANQTTVDRVQNNHPANHGPERLFSRSTPSANVDPQVALSTSTDRPRDNEMDAMLRGNSNFDQDDVFADSGNAAKSFNRDDLMAESSNRKDSEETQRYTEDPTNPRMNHLKNHSQQDGGQEQMYDEEQYLLPAPNKAPVYLDPEGALHPVVDQSVSLMNDTYVDSPPSSGPPLQTPEQDYGHLASYLTQPENEYVNTAGEENRTPTVFSNEEYMATDSGIGEDSQSLLSRGNTGNRGQRKESARSSGGDNQRYMYNDANVQFRPNQSSQNGMSGHGDKLLSTSSDGSSTSRSPKTAINNPEYMLVNNSTSNNTAQSERTSPNENA